MKSLSALSLVAALAIAGSTYSCAKSDDTGPSDDSGNSGSGSSGNATGSTSSSAGNVSLGSGGSGSSSASTATSADGVDACGVSNVEAELTPIYMVFVIDKSQSMGATSEVAAQRWIPVTAGVKDFFTNSGTSNVQASITYFAYPADATGTCAHDYSVPNVEMTSLDDPQALIDSINATAPSDGTPTLPAVYGGIKMAKQLLTDHPGSQAVVVLVTDGEPNVCDVDLNCNLPCAPAGVNLTNDVAGVSTVVSAAYRGTPSIPTYVIGIGDVNALEAIATAGGTEFISVSLTDAAATTETIVSNLTAIQSKQISCNIPIPTTEDGYDINNVNVNFVQSDGTVVELSRDDNCAGTGWRYDDAADPQYIELCTDTCDAIQEDIDGSVKIVLGCPTRVIT